MQTDDGPVEGPSRSEYVTVPVKMSRLWCDLKAVPLSLFRCFSLYPVHRRLTHSHKEVKTLWVPF